MLGLRPPPFKCVVLATAHWVASLRGKMKDNKIPNPNSIFPIPNIDTITYVKPSIKNPNIIVGDFTYFGTWEQSAPDKKELPLKGDTIVGNDVWIGQNVTILPGVHIGNGAIIGANSVVGKNVEPYSVVIGNPAKEIRKRFDDELIEIMEKLKWWDKPIEEINSLIPILTCSDLNNVKEVLRNKI